MKSKQGYALKLETAFRINNSISVSADAFRINYYSALESGLGYLVAQGVLTSADINQWMEEYGFASFSFDEIINDEEKREQLDEMLMSLNSLCNRKRMEE